MSSQVYEHDYLLRFLGSCLGRLLLADTCAISQYGLIGEPNEKCFTCTQTGLNEIIYNMRQHKMYKMCPGMEVVIFSAAVCSSWLNWLKVPFSTYLVEYFAVWLESERLEGAFKFTLELLKADYTNYACWSWSDFHFNPLSLFLFLICSSLTSMSVCCCLSWPCLP